MKKKARPLEGMGDNRYFSLYNEYLMKLLSEILSDIIFIAFQYQMPMIVIINHTHTLTHAHISVYIRIYPSICTDFQQPY